VGKQEQKGYFRNNVSGICRFQVAVAWFKSSEVLGSKVLASGLRLLSALLCPSISHLTCFCCPLTAGSLNLETCSKEKAGPWLAPPFPVLYQYVKGAPELHIRHF